MQLTESQLIEFKKIYKQKFGVELNERKALNKSLILINLVNLIIKK